MEAAKNGDDRAALSRRARVLPAAPPLPSSLDSPARNHRIAAPLQTLAGQIRAPPPVFPSPGLLPSQLWPPGHDAGEGALATRTRCLRGCSGYQDATAKLRDLLPALGSPGTMLRYRSGLAHGGAASEPATEEVGASWQREKLRSELPRPPTIPFQPRVANAISLVGTVGAPVQLQRLPDRRFSAVSVLVQDRRADFPKFWQKMMTVLIVEQASQDHPRNLLSHLGKCCRSTEQWSWRSATHEIFLYSTMIRNFLRTLLSAFL